MNELICGDYRDKDGRLLTVIPCGSSEWEQIENLRALARQEGVRVSIRHQNCYTTVNSEPTEYINTSGQVFNL